MAHTPDMFAGILTSAVLCAGGEDVQSAVVDDMVDGLERDGDLDSQIARSRKHRKEAGDFGMEIASALLVPVLIEAGKGLWAAYLKKLGEKAGGQLVDLTYQQVSKLVQWLFTGEERDQAQAAFNERLRAAAAQQGLSSEQVDALVAAVSSPALTAALDAKAKG
ncbi:MAG TPA: hypothetical protein VN201_04870 [Roseateles sp.]|nr:hypothetical protein [Roseateles sp.]